MGLDEQIEEKALIEHNWEKVKELANCMNESHSRNADFDSAQPANNSEPEVNQPSSKLSRSLSKLKWSLSGVEMANSTPPTPDTTPEVKE